MTSAASTPWTALRQHRERVRRAGAALGRRRPPRAGAVRGQAGHRRPGPDGRADARRPARPRALLLEGVPGVAKTLAVETLAPGRRRHVRPPAVHARPGARRHRRHPHLPAGQDAFDVELGPVFANFVLADEINRAPAKVQSALLEVMAERQVSIGGVTHPVPEPFLVLATQNPIESEGVYPLPEAQRDRFLMKVARRLPDRRGGAGDRLPDGRRPAGRRDGARARRAAAAAGGGRRRSSCTTRSSTTRSGSCSPPARRASTAWPTSPRGLLRREPPRLARPDRRRPGAGADARPRLRRCRRTSSTSPADVLRHRLVLSYDALADGVPADHIVERIVQTVPLPQVAPRQRAQRLRAQRPGRPARAASAPQAQAHGRPTGRRSARRAGHRRTRTARTRRDPAAPASRPRRRPGPAHPGLLLHPATPGSGSTPATGDGAPPRFADGPADVLLRRLELTVRRRLDGLLQGDHLGLVPGLGQRGRGVPHVPPRGRRPADGLAGHRAHPGPARPGDDRRPRARDLGGRRPVGQPRLRHRRCEKRDLAIAGLAAVGHLTGAAATGSARSSPPASGSTAIRRCPGGWPPSGCCAPSSRRRGPPAAGAATWPRRSSRCAGRRAGAGSSS